MVPVQVDALLPQITLPVTLMGSTTRAPHLSILSLIQVGKSGLLQVRGGKIGGGRVEERGRGPVYHVRSTHLIVFPLSF